mgnify:CR=1 FL=1
MLQRHYGVLGRARSKTKSARFRNPTGNVTDWQRPVVKGTHAEEVAAALAHFGYGMQLKRAFSIAPRKERAYAVSWMQKPRNAWAHHILAIHKGKEGHWVLIKGVKLCDTFLGRALAVRVRWPAPRRAHHGGLRGEKTLQF